MLDTLTREATHFNLTTLFANGLIVRCKHATCGSTCSIGTTPFHSARRQMHQGARGETAAGDRRSERTRPGQGRTSQEIEAPSSRPTLSPIRDTSRGDPGSYGSLRTTWQAANGYGRSCCRCCCCWSCNFLLSLVARSWLCFST